ncbi:hypothetical protein AB0G32_03450 [Streptomyces sp. NPDC023723]|uniref:hypothetical protein n=1 Tax=Streptomyces sp. NPDC023723 TaxID=3154323 RepID=UPI0033D4566F
MSASQTQVPQVPQVPMRDLLAACAAARTISTPPRAPDPEPRQSTPAEHRDAA